jgi:hypothetical protein
VQPQSDDTGHEPEDNRSDCDVVMSEAAHIASTINAADDPDCNANCHQELQMRKNLCESGYDIRYNIGDPSTRDFNPHEPLAEDVFECETDTRSAHCSTSTCENEEEEDGQMDNEDNEDGVGSRSTNQPESSNGVLISAHRLKQPVSLSFCERATQTIAYPDIIEKTTSTISSRSEKRMT